MIGFVRWNLDLVREGVWREVVLGELAYEAKRWRCLLLGHRWGDDRFEYEDAGYPVHVGTWEDCVRKGCCAAREVWSVYGPARGVCG